MLGNARRLEPPVNKLLPLLLLGGCGPDLITACEEYVNAANGCAREAYDDASAYEIDPTSTCAPYAEMKGAEATEALIDLQCLAAAYTRDCEAAEGYSAAETEAASCG
jgi:hypothetical protein